MNVVRTGSVDKVSEFAKLFILLAENGIQLDGSVFPIVTHELVGGLDLTSRLLLLNQLSDAGHSRARLEIVTSLKDAFRYTPTAVLGRLVNICWYFEALENALSKTDVEAEGLVDKVAMPIKIRDNHYEQSLFEKVDGITNADLAFLKQGGRTSVLVRDVYKRFLKIKDLFFPTAQPQQDYYQLICDAVPEIKLLLKNELIVTNSGLDKEEVLGIVSLAAKVFGLN